MPDAHVDLELLKNVSRSALTWSPAYSDLVAS